MGSLQSKLITPSSEAMQYLHNQELKDVQQIFEQLSMASPRGQTTTIHGIDKATFGEYFPYPGVLRDQIFNIFDTNKDGLINREEFMCGMALCCQGKMTSKLQFCFNMFDLSGDGMIDRDELMRCLNSTAFASFALLHAVSDQLNEQASIDSAKTDEDDSDMEEIEQTMLNPSQFHDEVKAMVDEAFQKCDLNSDGLLSLDEFRSWMLQTPEVLSILYGVFEMRRHVSVAEITEEFQLAHENYAEAEVDQYIEQAEAKLASLLAEKTELSAEFNKLVIEKRHLTHEHETSSGKCDVISNIKAKRDDPSKSLEIERFDALNALSSPNDTAPPKVALAKRYSGEKSSKI